MFASEIAAVGPRPVTGGRAPGAKGDGNRTEAGAPDASTEETEGCEAKAAEKADAGRKDFETALEEEAGDPGPTVAELVPDAGVPAIEVPPPAVAALAVPVVPGDAIEDAEPAAALPAKSVAVPTTAPPSAPASAAPPGAPATVTAPADDAGAPALAEPAPAAAAARPLTETPPPSVTAAEVTAEPEVAPSARFAADPAPAPPDPDARPAAPRPDAAPTAPGLSLTSAAGADWRLSAAAPATREGIAQTAIHLPAPEPRAIAGQITLAVGNAAGRSVEIRLDPPELGRVHIQLTPTEQGLQAVVLAERPETHDFLRRHAETLTKDLNAAGYANVTLDFATGGQDAPRDGDREAQARIYGFGGEQTAAAAQAPVAGTRATGSGALDIRL